MHYKCCCIAVSLHQVVPTSGCIPVPRGVSLGTLLMCPGADQRHEVYVWSGVKPDGLLLYLGTVPSGRQPACVLVCLQACTGLFCKASDACWYLSGMLVLVIIDAVSLNQCVPVLLQSCHVDVMLCLLGGRVWTTPLTQWSAAGRLREARSWAKHRRATPVAE